jgi:hypothetical protein
LVQGNEPTLAGASKLDLDPDLAQVGVGGRQISASMIAVAEGFGRESMVAELGRSAA